MYRSKPWVAVLSLLMGCAADPAPDGSSLKDLKNIDATAGEDVEADIANPFLLSFGEYQAVLTLDDTGDAFGFETTPGQRIDVQLIPDGSLDIGLRLTHYSDDFEDVELDDGVHGGNEEYSFSFDASHAQSGARFGFLAYAKSGAGAYRMAVMATPQNDGGAGKDAPVGKAAYYYDQLPPIELEPGVYEGNYLGGYDLRDTFSITLFDGQTLTVSIIPDAELDVAYIPGTYCDENGCNLSPGDAVNTAFKGKPESFTYTANGLDAFRFVVMKVGNSSGSYRLSLTVD